MPVRISLDVYDRLISSAFRITSENQVNMKLVKHPYTDKPFVEVYEYIPVAIMPIIVFQASFMVLSQLLLIEWIGCLFIFFVLYLQVMNQGYLDT